MERVKFFGTVVLCLTLVVVGRRSRRNQPETLATSLSRPWQVHGRSLPLKGENTFLIFDPLNRNLKVDGILESAQALSSFELHKNTSRVPALLPAKASHGSKLWQR